MRRLLLAAGAALLVGLVFHFGPATLLEMAKRHLGSVLVMRRGRLAGIFTATDACHAFGEFIRERYPPPHGDDAA